MWRILSKFFFFNFESCSFFLKMQLFKIKCGPSVNVKILTTVFGKKRLFLCDDNKIVFLNKWKKIPRHCHVFSRIYNFKTWLHFITRMFFIWFRISCELRLRMCACLSTFSINYSCRYEDDLVRHDTTPPTPVLRFS